MLISTIVQVHRSAVTVTALREFNFIGCDLVTFHSEALKPGIEDSPVVELALRDIERAVVHGRAFASLKSFTANYIFLFT